LLIAPERAGYGQAAIQYYRDRLQAHDDPAPLKALEAHVNKRKNRRREIRKRIQQQELGLELSSSAVQKTAIENPRCVFNSEADAEAEAEDDAKDEDNSADQDDAEEEDDTSKEPSAWVELPEVVGLECERDELLNDSGHSRKAFLLSWISMASSSQLA
jgi:hypothetical protein